VTEDQPLLSRRRPANSPAAISRSVPQTPSAMPSTSSSPVPRFRLIDLDDGGRPRFQGTTVSARIAPVSLCVSEVWERINQGLAKALPGFS
jgi:hypothetical protein